MEPPAEALFEGALKTGPPPECVFEGAMKMRPPHPPCTPWSGCTPFLFGVTMSDASPPGGLVPARTKIGEKTPTEFVLAGAVDS